MKKLTALLLAVMLVASMAVAVSAESITTLTTTVPAATYTLNIPADQEIPFGEYETDIGNITVSNTNGFARGKNLNVTLTYDAFKCENANTIIPFSVVAEFNGTHGDTEAKIISGEALVFEGQADGSLRAPHRIVNTNYGADLENLYVRIKSEDWGKALGGEYTATITFTAEVVAE